jgi:hypothetical protein
MKNRKDELQITIEKDVPIDPGVILPADVQATIARGEAALSQARSVRIGKAAPARQSPRLSHQSWTKRFRILATLCSTPESENRRVIVSNLQ